MAAPLTLSQVNDLARWAFGPFALARHNQAVPRPLRCEIRIPTGEVFQHHHGATWAEVFRKAGWEFPPLPRHTFIQVGQAIYRVQGEAREHVASASSVRYAQTIAACLNDSRSG
jgi:hypothetical protein